MKKSMRTVSALWAAMALLLGLCFSALATAQESYTLGAGDRIRIQVFNEEDLSLEVQLTDKGSFSYPFIGEVKAKGLSLAELEGFITDKLAGDYLINPRVTVSILDYRPFFVNGEVEKPGGYPFQPGLTLRKAIALSGGFTDRASRSKIFVIHDKTPDMEPRQIDLNTPVLPGDIITVEESFF